MDIYKLATKLKVRFSSTKGELTVEQLWDLPLNSATKANLNDVARGVSQSITTIEDFVGGTSSDNSIAELKLNILKDIIADKKQELTDRANIAKIATEIANLEEFLEGKEDATMAKKSKKEIKAEIERLEA